MRVVIKDREYEYVSDYPAGWQFSAGDPFKLAVRIGNYTCFVKRLEKKQPADISGWQLLEQLKGKFVPNLPRLYDIVRTTEDQQPVYYLFYEHLAGQTLQQQVMEHEPVDLTRLTADLFRALAAIHRQAHWFADFTEKNIFYEETNQRYLLIDLDSVQSTTARPDHDLYGDNAYWALVLRFYREEVGYTDLPLTALPGPVLNYLQVIFLILRLKLYQAASEQVYQNGKGYEQLVGYLAAAEGDFRQVFERAYQDSRSSPYLSWGGELQASIEQHLIGGAFVLPAREPAEMDVAHPVIRQFGSSATEVEAGQRFTLSWQIEQATKVELFRNGLFFQEVAIGEEQVAVQEEVAGEVQYVLRVTNQAYQTDSKPMRIRIKEVPAVPIPASEPKPDESDSPPVIIITPTPESSRPKNRRTTSIILFSILGSLAVIVALFFWLPLRPKPQIYGFRSYLPTQRLVVITGKHFPRKTQQVQVLFDKKSGKVIRVTPDSLRVLVPEISHPPVPDSVRLAVVVNGDTAYAPHYLIWISRQEASAGVPPVPIDSALLPIEEEPVPPELPLTEFEAGPVVKPPAAETPAPVVGKVNKPRPNRPKPGDKQPPTKSNAPKPSLNVEDFTRRYLVVKSNVTVKKVLGGIKNLVITVENRSKYHLDTVQVELIYLNNNQKELAKRYLVFQQVKAFSAASNPAPDFERGRQVQFTIKKVASAELARDFRLE